MNITLIDLKPNETTPCHLQVKVDGVVTGYLHRESWPGSAQSGYRFKPAAPGPTRPQHQRYGSLIMKLAGPDFGLPIARANAVVGKMNLRRFAARNKRRHPRLARPHKQQTGTA